MYVEHTYILPKSGNCRKSSTQLCFGFFLPILEILPNANSSPLAHNVWICPPIQTRFTISIEKPYFGCSAPLKLRKWSLSLFLSLSIYISKTYIFSTSMYRKVETTLKTINGSHQNWEFSLSLSKTYIFSISMYRKLETTLQN